MALTSYDDLQASMSKFLKRNDLSALLPDFIMLAEQHFDRKIKTRARRATFSSTPTKHDIALPSDWGRVIHARYGHHPVDFYPPSYDEKLIYRGYQILGNTLRLRVPQLGEKLVLEYFVVIEPLSESNQSNWLLEDAPDIYLAGCLHEAFSYIRDDDRSAFWMNKRDMAIQEFIDEDAESKTPTEQPLVMRGS